MPRNKVKIRVNNLNQYYDGDNSSADEDDKAPATGGNVNILLNGPAPTNLTHATAIKEAPDIADGNAELVAVIYRTRNSCTWVYMNGKWNYL